MRFQLHGMLFFPAILGSSSLASLRSVPNCHLLSEASFPTSYAAFKGLPTPPDSLTLL